MDDFSDKQLNSFKALITEALRLNNQQLLHEVDARFRINNDITLQEIRASEHRLEQKVDFKIDTLRRQIAADTAAVIGGSILPQIDDHNVRLTKLETQRA